MAIPNPIVIPMTVSADMVSLPVTVSVDAVTIALEVAAAIYASPIEEYTGAYTVTPLAYEEQVLPTKNKAMLHDVTVREVPYFQTSNPFGDTVYIASEV